MLPVLWSFRRCPYAMRARLGLASAGQQVSLREIVLRDKPEAFLKTSKSATVPCLDFGAEQIDESLDIMLWALSQSDPEDLLAMPALGHELIAECDGPLQGRARPQQIRNPLSRQRPPRRARQGQRLYRQA
jgi:glutathione S-transferase